MNSGRLKMRSIILVMILLFFQFGISQDYSVTAFEPLASIDLCEQIFYKWIGISFVEGVKINQNGYEISFSLGLMLKNYSRSKEDNRHIISTTIHNKHQ